MDRYSCLPGRAIYRNNAPFVSIAGCARELPGYAPADFDTFAKAIPALIEAARILCESHTKGTDAWPAIVAAGAALDLLPKQEG